ncbi:hypothetical protein [Actinomadura macrotermitis]|uniref:Uncharacterized protein n=1 Tax=Actinomadura macrotermitis TaxID=2585200 RepID=A0A7K0BR36_9ACTN|nr:hypothetical protein [Actinomadura macrotermitis]MQY03601.1 hypothetical protein [Actinomadura macrotermitis]
MRAVPLADAGAAGVGSHTFVVLVAAGLVAVVAFGLVYVTGAALTERQRIATAAIAACVAFYSAFPFFEDHVVPDAPQVTGTGSPAPSSTGQARQGRGGD